FATAPGTPVPPALRAVAAHPMTALPPQVAGLLTLPAMVTATGLVPLAATGVTAFTLTAAVPVAVTIGLRHAVRHSRLAGSAVTLRRASAWPARRVAVEQLQD
ncbi:MAG TPA: hypothetical protein VGD43_20420, partial [Micromonospora sp.]